MVCRPAAPLMAVLIGALLLPASAGAQSSLVLMPQADNEAPPPWEAGLFAGAAWLPD